MRQLITFALRQRLYVAGGVLTLIAAGLWALMRMPFDAFPDLTGTRVEVITTAPALAAEEVERLVTYPLESSLMGLPGAEGVRSVSKAGLSLITVPFPDDMDIYFARTLVQQRLADAKGALPAGVEPTLGPVSTPMGELYQYTITSDSLSLAELKTLHDYVIRPRLRTVVAPFRLDLTVSALRRLSTNVIDVLTADGRYVHALDGAHGPMIARVAPHHPEALQVTIEGDPRDVRRHGGVVDLLGRSLGVTRDLTPFSRAAASLPWLAPLARRMRGVKPPRYRTLWEAFVNAVVFQHVSLQAASAVAGRLINALGTPLESAGASVYLFPTADRS